MNCLNNYISIRWCKGTTPESGLFINDLPGISLKALDKIANDEQVTFLEVWNSIQRRAVQQINTDVVNEFAKRYKLNRLTETTTWLKAIDKTNNQTSHSAEYRGFEIEMGKPRWDTGLQMGWSSPLQVIHIENLSLYTKDDIAGVTIRFFELLGDTAVEIENAAIVFDSVQGWNNIPVNKDFFDVQRLFVAYDATNVDSVYLPLDENSSCIDCNVFLNFCECNALIRAAKSSNPVTTLEHTNNTFGLVGVVSIRCKFEQVVCNSKSLFATALWYLLGAECMAERIYTDRINRYTTIDLAKAKDLRSEFETRYKLELESTITGIELSTNDCCLQCNDRVRVVENRP